MSRKRREEQPVVSRKLLEQAKNSVSADGPRPTSPKKRRCKVCGAECAPFSVEDLCWVCRRLKISAWRDTDLQMLAQD